MRDFPELKQKMNKKFIKATILSEVLEDIIIVGVLALLYGLNLQFNWPTWLGWIWITLAVLLVIIDIWSIGLRPYLLYKNTRYEINEDYLQVKSGAMFEKFEMIPMTKIQSVETNQGPIMRKFDLCTVSVETMGSTHAILGIEKKKAIQARNDIAQFAKIKETAG
ncbi:MAG TPA: PH domain-containing protein [Pseudogracilibacillus sp.]|nr:PH domain-containing protein [Pseudogracilibacillus sp.]